MSDELKQQKARQTYETLCRSMDNHDWKYEKHEDNLAISCSARGDDLPVELTVTVDADRQVVMVLSRLPMNIPEDKRIDIAIAVSVANNNMVHGCFDFNLASGRLYFRMSNSFIDSRLGEDVFFYLVLCACRTVDEYNDRFLMLSKGMIDLKKFIELDNG